MSLFSNSHGDNMTRYVHIPRLHLFLAILLVLAIVSPAFSVTIEAEDKAHLKELEERSSLLTEQNKALLTANAGLIPLNEELSRITSGLEQFRLQAPTISDWQALDKLAAISLDDKKLATTLIDLTTVSANLHEPGLPEALGLAAKNTKTAAAPAERDLADFLTNLAQPRSEIAKRIQGQGNSLEMAEFPEAEQETLLCLVRANYLLEAGDRLYQTTTDLHQALIMLIIQINTVSEENQNELLRMRPELEFRRMNQPVEPEKKKEAGR